MEQPELEGQRLALGEWAQPFLGRVHLWKGKMRGSGTSPDKLVWQLPFLRFLSATVKHKGRDESREGGISAYWLAGVTGGS